eukprot:CAMPEP_0196682826 /NCGR_PEP_ID=MMETSP1090-20130531/9488_1 /TAXON_ID=37098 /ORGANISM="Isochrysis sp, Strain CCMP1244" /LENGTH=121 /DNA_ID=CAMNT_0042021253 /DNA_START=118 /DNA_END=480 /DNA_ORIENTATION=-
MSQCPSQIRHDVLRTEGRETDRRAVEQERGVGTAHVDRQALVQAVVVPLPEAERLEQQLEREARRQEDALLAGGDAEGPLHQRAAVKLGGRRLEVARVWRARLRARGLRGGGAERTHPRAD